MTHIVLTDLLQNFQQKGLVAQQAALISIIMNLTSSSNETNNYINSTIIIIFVHAVLVLYIANFIYLFLLTSIDVYFHDYLLNLLADLAITQRASLLPNSVLTLNSRRRPTPKIFSSRHCETKSFNQLCFTFITLAVYTNFFNYFLN